MQPGGTKLQAGPVLRLLQLIILQFSLQQLMRSCQPQWQQRQKSRDRSSRPAPFCCWFLLVSPGSLPLGAREWRDDQDRFLTSTSSFYFSSSTSAFCSPVAWSPRSASAAGAVARMRTPLLGQAAVFAALLTLCTCLTGSHICPRSLDCAQAGRHFCRPGSSHCGPCLHPLVENSHGRCVDRRRHAHHSAQPAKGR
ncbi:hypothetical protein XENORESO_017015 [Xenotaenia resolanae]|uniref:Uncharacterized protein n=1 Tax=Xenotaenia resolanae TaxID=208358 RepID=A0ABV0VUN7_9TELE